MPKKTIPGRMYRYEPMQRVLGLQRHRSSNCAGRGTEFDRCESPSRISLSRSLQHHTEPTPNICEKEMSMVTRATDGIEYEKPPKVFIIAFSELRELPPWT